MRGFRFLFEDGKLPLKTMTGDRGKEFACYQEVEKTLEVPFYFTRPHSPWQKPSVENLNGLVRQFFPERHQLSGDVPARSYPGHGYAQSQTQKVPPICLPC